MICLSFYAVVQTQFLCKIKIFQSDGGIEFLNHKVRSYLRIMGRFTIFHALTLHNKKKRVECKHRHIMERGS